MEKKMPLGPAGGTIKKNLKEMQGSYKKGKMVNKWYFYDPNGNLKEIRYFSPSF